jgi:hypothetical protein
MGANTTSSGYLPGFRKPLSFPQINMRIAEIGLKKLFTGWGLSAMLVERSRKYWSLVGQIKLFLNKFYEIRPFLNQGWFGRVSRLQCFAETTRRGSMKSFD